MFPVNQSLSLLKKVVESICHFIITSAFIFNSMKIALILHAFKREINSIKLIYPLLQISPILVMITKTKVKTILNVQF